MVLNSHRQSLLPRQGEVFYYPQFFSSLESSGYMSHLQREILWKHESIVLFGRAVMQPRLTAWYGDEGKDIRYSGISMAPQLWTPALLAIKARVEAVAQEAFSSVLLNQYRDGQDSVGWHRDNEKELGPRPVIASVSFGETRRFVFRHRMEKKLKVELQLESGSLLVMRGETQTYWEHALPKTPQRVGPRINLTFRRMI